MLCFYSDNINAATQVPKQLTGKVKPLLFIRLRPTALTSEAIDKEVLVSELTRSPLEVLELTLREVQRPLLTNISNQVSVSQTGSTHVVHTSVQEHGRAFAS